MNRRKHEDDYAETQLLDNAAMTDADAEATVVLYDEYRRQLETDSEPARAAKPKRR